MEVNNVKFNVTVGKNDIYELEISNKFETQIFRPLGAETVIKITNYGCKLNETTVK